MSEVRPKRRGADRFFYSSSLSSFSSVSTSSPNTVSKAAPLRFVYRHSGDRHSFSVEAKMQEEGFISVSRAWRGGMVDVAQFYLQDEDWRLLETILTRAGAGQWRENYKDASPLLAVSFPAISAISLEAAWPELKVKTGFNGQDEPEGWFWAQKVLECLLKEEVESISDIYAEQTRAIG